MFLALYLNLEKQETARKLKSFTSLMNQKKNNNVSVISIVIKMLKARANERNNYMLCQHVGYNMVRSFVHHVGLCCMMLVYVAFSLRPAKLFAQHMQTFLLFSGDR